MINLWEDYNKQADFSLTIITFTRNTHLGSALTPPPLLVCVCVHVFVIGDTCCCWKRCGNDEHQVTTYAVGPNLIGLLLSMKIGVAPGAISQTFLDTFLFIYPFYGPVYFCSFCLLQSCFLCHLGSHDFFFWLFTFAYCIWICTEGNKNVIFEWVDVTAHAFS